MCIWKSFKCVLIGALVIKVRLSIKKDPKIYYFIFKVIIIMGKNYLQSNRYLGSEAETSSGICYTLATSTRLSNSLTYYFMATNKYHFTSLISLMTTHKIAFLLNHVTKQSNWPDFQVCLGVTTMTSVSMLVALLLLSVKTFG